jgi:hypothetical protein
MTQEQLRMQMLAGIITESQYKAMLNEDIQKVTLYATYFNPKEETWDEKTGEEEEWDNHLESEILFPTDYYKSAGKLIPVDNKGMNMSEGRIGCQFTRFPITGHGAPDSEVYVKFEKPISEVYLDDDIEPEEIVNDVEGFEEWYEGNSEEQTGKPVSLADISQFGITTDGSGYGLYVKEINRSEVKSIESGFEGMDLKPFEI